MQNSFDTFIFDLDGTLLDTLPDLVDITNRTLRDLGHAEVSTEEIHNAIGGGLRVLLHSITPPGTSEESVNELMEYWQKLYPEYGIVRTEVYPGIEEMIQTLFDQGKNLAVLSNKFDQGVHDVIPRFFPGKFKVFYGVKEGIPRKPDPQGLNKIIEELGAHPSTTLYIGDSPTDIRTAQAAGVRSAAVTWGYRSVEDLRNAGPDILVNEPKELLVLL